VTLHGIGRWLVRAGWALGAIVLGWLVMFSGTDPASTILFGLAIAAVALALRCAGRAFDAPGRAKLTWIGRALALVGAAVAISFPAVLYQEIAMIAAQGRALSYDIPRALWFEAATMPLVVIPALVALRWSRAGAMLFLLDGLFNVAMSVYQPFGVLYPEAAGSGPIGVPILDLIVQPQLVVAALLLLGRGGGTSEMRPAPGIVAV